MAITTFSNEYLFKHSKMIAKNNVKKSLSAFCDLLIGSIVLFIISFL